VSRRSNSVASPDVPHARSLVAVAFLVLLGGIGGFAAAAGEPAIDGPAVITRGAVRLDAPIPVSADDSSRTAALLMADLVNAERVARGLAALAWDERVATAALGHSVDQAARGTMTHVGSDGSNAGDRLIRAGYVWSSWGETLAAGSIDARAMLDAWLASSGHAQRLLDTAAKHIGVGIATSANGTPYWTLVVAAP
jgi:uncharacterized protein YkwD